MPAFTVEQQLQIDRLSLKRRTELSDKKLARRTPEQLRARVNILGVSDTVSFASENDYSAAETALIAAVHPREKWMLAVPELLAGAAKLRAEGMSETVISAILKK